MPAHLILLRHAERPNIPSDEVGNEVSLTKQGIHQTKLFAKSLKQPIISISSSPILRCVQTAEIISNHCSYNKIIKKSLLLGDPGFFIKDPELAWIHWQTKGHDAVNQYLLSGKDQWQGFHPFDNAINRMKAEITKQLEITSSGLHVWVSHDTILATFASRVLPQSLTLNNWPNFLGYLDIYQDEKNNLKYNNFS
jgi:broad specificity phosphatase PhoE